MAVNIVRVPVPLPSGRLKAVFDEIQQGLQHPSPPVGEHWRLRLDGCLGRVRSVLKQLQITPKFQDEGIQGRLPDICETVSRINKLIRTHVNYARSTLKPTSSQSEYVEQVDEVEDTLHTQLRGLYDVCIGVPDEKICVATGCNAPMPDVESVFPTLPTVYVGRENLERKILTAVRTGHGLCKIESHECHQHPIAMPAHLEGAIGQTIVGENTTLVIAKPVSMGMPRLILLSGPGGIGKSTMAHSLGRVLSGEFPDGDFFIELHSKRDAGLPSAAAMLIALRQKHGIAWKLRRDMDIKAEYRNIFVNKRNLMILDDAGDADTVRELLPYGSDCCVIITSPLPLLDDLVSDVRLCILCAEEMGPIAEDDAAYYLRATVPALQPDVPDERPFPPREIGLFEVPGAVPALASFLSRGMSHAPTLQAAPYVPASPTTSLLSELEDAATYSPTASPHIDTLTLDLKNLDDDTATEMSEGEGMTEVFAEVHEATPAVDDDYGGYDFFGVVDGDGRVRDDDLDALVYRLVSACAGVPLALQIAAGYLRRDRFDGSDDSIRIIQKIERYCAKQSDSVMALFAASFNNLPDAAQRLFVASSVFPSYFMYEDAVAICMGVFDDTGDYTLPDNIDINIFDVLVRSGILRPDTSHNCGVRYRQHERLRLWSLKKISGWGDTVPWRMRFGMLTLKKLRDAEELFTSGDHSHKAEGFTAAASELVNILSLRALARHRRHASLFAQHFCDVDVFAATVPNCLRVTLLTRLVDGLAQVHHTSPQHVNLLLSLANVFLETGQLTEAEPLFRRTLRLCESLMKGEGVVTAVACNNLAAVLHELGSYDEAVPLYERALSLHREGGNQGLVAEALNNFGVLCFESGNYSRAAELLKEAIVLREEVFGPGSLPVAASVLNLAQIYKVKGHFSDAEVLFKRALGIQKLKLGHDHMLVASTANLLGELNTTIDEYGEAEKYLKQAQKIQEDHAVGGGGVGELSVTLHNLATVMDEKGIYDKAELLARRSLDLKTSVLGGNHHSTAKTLNLLAGLYRTQAKYELAEPLYKQALKIREHTLGQNHIDVATTLYNYAALLTNMRRFSEAEPIYKRALHIVENVLSPRHPRIATTLNHLGRLYAAQKKWDEAEEHYTKALQLQEEELGPQHPDLAATLNNTAVMFKGRSQYGESEKYYRRALDIQEAVLGADHPNVAVTLNNLASLCHALGKYDDAVAMLERAMEIYSSHLSADHPTTVSMRNSLARVRRKAASAPQGKDEEEKKEKESRFKGLGWFKRG